MLKITTMFANRIPTTNLIFKNEDNEGTNIIYFPELPNRGTSLINQYRKKGYWAYVVIPPTFTFMGRKILTNAYYKDFKKEIPTIRPQRKFAKGDSGARSVVVDLTPLSEDFAAFAKSRSKKMLMEAFIDLVEKFSLDNNTITGHDCYLLIDGDNTEERDCIKSLLYYSRLNSNKVRIKNITGILLYGNKKFWPLTTLDKDKEGEYLKVNINILTRYMKEVHLEDIGEKEETAAESMDTTKKIVEQLYKSHIGRQTTTAEKMFTAGAKKAEDIIEENPLELIKVEVLQNKNIPGKGFEEKLSNLFKEEPAPESDSSAGAGKSKSKSKSKTGKTTEAKIPRIVKKINENLQELNKQYNGVVNLDESTIDRNASSFYKPLNVVGFSDFSAYGKQKSEFGKNLDQAMYELIKSFETDKELGIKVLNIKTEITDTYRDRFKTYRVKLQHKSFGYKKPYFVSFRIPIPSKGKYLKVGGNSYIMTNQLYSKPVVKVNPKLVRLYTHYSTCAIHLKQHSLNEADGIDTMLENFADQLRYGKKLKSQPEPLTKDQITDIKAKYDLPEFMNHDLFVNLEIKS